MCASLCGGIFPAEIIFCTRDALTGTDLLSSEGKLDLMFKSGFVLHSPQLIEAAMFNKTHVIVWHNGRIIDYGGVIQSHNDEIVNIKGEDYEKATCEFRV